MLFHRTLDALVDEAREGNDDSFLNAIRIDRSIITCPTFALRIAKAEIKNDKKFFSPPAQLPERALEETLGILQGFTVCLLYSS